jgi:hypothetical protein
MQFQNPNEVDYYFGRLLRSEAEIILTRAGKTDGLFLLREKTNSIGSYALSICFENSIKHYAIVKQDDKTFKIEDDKISGKPYISPIELIEKENNLCCKPSFKCSRPRNSKPISYLFISSENYNKSLENQKIKSRKENISVGRFDHKYEKLVLDSIHFSQSWCLKDTNSKEAENLFRVKGYEDGKFMLRYTKFLTKFKYQLSICFENTIHHYRINSSILDQYFIDMDKKFLYLAQLIDYYGREQGCLVTKLKLPYNANTKTDCDTNQNYENIMLDIQLTFIRIIAPGPISNVYEVQYKEPETTKTTTIAIKFLKNNYNEDILKSLKPHPNIVSTEKLADSLNIRLSNSSKVMSGGLCESNISQIISHFEPNFNIEKLHPISSNFMEYSRLGTLNNYVKQNKNLIEKSEILQYVTQILSGLEFIAENKIVHRNVSARNVLLFEDKKVKICGFGLAKYIGQSSNDHIEIERYLPSRWYPPEAFDKIFSEKTDVYSFAVLLWELFSNGRLPYSEISTDTEENMKNFIKSLKSGNLILDRPENCPDYIYRLMRECWHLKPAERPTFKKLNFQYQEYLENLDFNNDMIHVLN